MQVATVLHCFFIRKHNNIVKNLNEMEKNAQSFDCDAQYSVSDLAIESANQNAISQYAKRTSLDFGIIRYDLNVKTVEQSRELSKPCGVYITFDAPKSVQYDDNVSGALIRYLSTALKNTVGIVKKSAPVLVVGLGNKNITADALGQIVVDNVRITSGTDAPYNQQRVCALSTGVLGTTGMQTVDILCGVADKIKPCLVIAADSLATSSVSRVGCSFQLSTAGITPGSGVGQDRERIDKSILGVPVISIGVPLMLTMRTALYSFVKGYMNDVGQSVDEFRLRQNLADSNLLKLVVAPKEIDYLANKCAYIIADAINKTFEN